MTLEPMLRFWRGMQTARIPSYLAGKVTFAYPPKKSARATLDRVQGYLAHEKMPTPLRQGSRGVRFRVSEVPLYINLTSAPAGRGALA